MPDREKVIERLKGLQTAGESAGSMGVFILPDLIREVVALLEEQEPVKPQIGGNPDYTWWYICPKCQLSIDKNDRFCRHCGRRMDWDE